MYYRGASAAIVVYDICSPQSFSKVKEWVNELKLNIQDEISMFWNWILNPLVYHLVMVIVGNKVDKAEKSRQIRADVGREYALSVSASFIECSAKTKEGTNDGIGHPSHKPLSWDAHLPLNSFSLSTHSLFLSFSYHILGVEELFKEVSQKLVQNKKNIQKAPISATLTGTKR